MRDQDAPKVFDSKIWKTKILSMQCINLIDVLALLDWFIFGCFVSCNEFNTQCDLKIWVVNFSFILLLLFFLVSLWFWHCSTESWRSGETGMWTERCIFLRIAHILCPIECLLQIVKENRSLMLALLPVWIASLALLLHYICLNLKVVSFLIHGWIEVMLLQATDFPGNLWSLRLPFVICFNFARVFWMYGLVCYVVNRSSAFFSDGRFGSRRHTIWHSSIWC